MVICWTCHDHGHGVSNYLLVRGDACSLDWSSCTRFPCSSIRISFLGGTSWPTCGFVAVYKSMVREGYRGVPEVGYLPSRFAILVFFSFFAVVWYVLRRLDKRSDQSAAIAVRRRRVAHRLSNWFVIKLRDDDLSDGAFLLHIGCLALRPFAGLLDEICAVTEVHLVPRPLAARLELVKTRLGLERWLTDLESGDSGRCSSLIGIEQFVCLSGHHKFLSINFSRIKVQDLWGLV